MNEATISGNVLEKMHSHRQEGTDKDQTPSSPDRLGVLAERMAGILAATRVVAAPFT